MCRELTDANMPEPYEILEEQTFQNELQGLVLDSMAEGVCCIDAQGCITFLNRSALRMYQVERSQVLGKDIHSTLHQGHSFATSLTPDKCPICRNLRSKWDCFVNHEVFWRPNGTSFPVEYSVRPINKDGAHLGMVVTFADVTMRPIPATEMLYVLTSAKCLRWYGDVEYVQSKDLASRRASQREPRQTQAWT